VFTGALALLGLFRYYIGTMDFSVIKTGGKQYVVKAGETLKIEKLDGDMAKGDVVKFDQVLLTSVGGIVTIGTPFIDGGVVEANFEEQGRNKKVVVIKYKQKSRYFKKNGHKQPHTKVTIK
jgi:large subunit ribosomal protein L21